MEDDNLFTGVLWSLLLWVLLGSLLKLSGFVTLSWPVILFPLWLPLVGFLGLLVVALFAYLIVTGGGSGQ